MQFGRDEFYRALIYRNYEGRNVEYKSSRPWEGIKRDRLIKAILCIANAGGGYIIVGYDERKANDFEKRTGIQQELIGSWETTKVNGYINNYCAPPINVEVIPFKDISENDKTYIIISIPSHAEKPFICTKDKIIDDSDDKDGRERKEIILRKSAIYYRTKNNSCEEISDPSYFDELFGRCISYRKDELLKSFSEILEVNYKNKIRGYKEQEDPFKEMDKCKSQTEQFITPNVQNLTFMEISSIPRDKRHLNASEVKKALKESSKDYGLGWAYIFFLEGLMVSPQYANDMIFEVNSVPSSKNPLFDYWAFYYETGIFYSRNSSAYYKNKQPDKFSYFHEAKIIGEAIISIGHLYHKLGYALDSDIIIAIRYSPVENIVVIDNSTFRRECSEPFKDNELTHKIIKPVADCLNKSAHVASDIIFNLLSKLGFCRNYSAEKFIGSIEDHLKNTKN